MRSNREHSPRTRVAREARARELQRRRLARVCEGDHDGSVKLGDICVRMLIHSGNMCRP
jgi:hypothetical protein